MSVVGWAQEWEAEVVESEGLEAWAVLVVELDGLDNPCRSGTSCPNPCCTEPLVLHLDMIHTWSHRPRHSSNTSCLMGQELALAVVWVLAWALVSALVSVLALVLAPVLALVLGQESANLHNRNLKSMPLNNLCYKGPNCHQKDTHHTKKHPQIGCNNIWVLLMQRKPTRSKVLSVSL